MKSKTWNQKKKMRKRGAAAAVALFLAAVVWRKYGGFGLLTVNAWLVGMILIIIAVTDVETLRIPNRMTAALLIPVLLSCAAEPELTPLNRVLGGLAVSLPMGIMVLAIPQSFGGGDIKLMAVCGLLLGTPRILAAAFLAVVTGGGYAIWLLVKRRAGRGDHFAFGPFLAAGVMAALLYGTDLLSWYFTWISG